MIELRGGRFNSRAVVENAKRENVEAMFKTVETYGRK
jgi:hypothetical protein